MIITFTIEDSTKNVMIICPKCGKRTRIDQDDEEGYFIAVPGCDHIYIDHYSDFTGFIINTEDD